MNTQSVVILVLIPLFIWRLYSRMRRLVGRQQSKAWRHWITIVVFPLLILSLGARALPDTFTVGSLAGVLQPASLAIVGLSLTRFESTSEGFFYTPNAHIGIGLSLLLTGRILYRLAQVSGGVAQQGTDNFARSPFTLVIFGTLAGYYVTYAMGILHFRSKAGLTNT